MRNHFTTALMLAMMEGIATAVHSKVLTKDDAEKLLIIIQADFLRLVKGEVMFGYEVEGCDKTKGMLTGANPKAVSVNKLVTDMIDHNDPDHVLPKGYVE